MYTQLPNTSSRGAGADDVNGEAYSGRCRLYNDVISLWHKFRQRRFFDVVRSPPCHRDGLSAYDILYGSLVTNHRLHFPPEVPLDWHVFLIWAVGVVVDPSIFVIRNVHSSVSTLENEHEHITLWFDFDLESL